MAKNEQLIEITNTMIKKLHDEVNELQAEALKLSSAGEYDRLHEILTKQRSAVGAQIAMVEAAQHLQS